MKKQAFVAVLLLGAGVSVFSVLGLGQSNADRCEALAASPLEKGSNGAGVQADKIDTAAAIPTCEAAFKEDPGSAIIGFRLGRALQMAGRDEEAAAHYEAAAEQGVALAARNLVVLHVKSNTMADPEEAKRWHLKAAELGDVESQRSLGKDYYRGNGFPQNNATAAYWYQKAADQGDAEATFLLGSLYDNGIGVGRNLDKAFELYLKAAQLGNPSAQNNVASMYAKGEGVAVDQYEATRWFKAASNAGVKEARRTMGFRLYKGVGAERDPQMAFTLLTSLHHEGDLYSTFGLGLIYLEYFNNYETAERLLRQAAASNDPQLRSGASRALGNLHEARSGGLTGGQIVLGLIGLGIGLAILAGPSSPSSASVYPPKTWTPPDAFSPDNIGAAMLWLE